MGVSPIEFASEKHFFKAPEAIKSDMVNPVTILFIVRVKALIY